MKQQQHKNDTPNVKPANMDNESKKPSFYENLKQKRDELRLQSHLFSKEAERTWGELETDWHKMASMMKERQGELKDTSSKIYQEFKHMAEDMKHRYDKFRNNIKH